MALAKLYLDRTDNRKGYKYFTFGVRLLLTVIRFLGTPTQLDRVIGQNYQVKIETT